MNRGENSGYDRWIRNARRCVLLHDETHSQGVGLAGGVRLKLSLHIARRRVATNGEG